MRGTEATRWSGDLSQLVRETARLVRDAQDVEAWNRHVQDEIGCAYGQGMTYEEREARNLAYEAGLVALYGAGRVAERPSSLAQTLEVEAPRAAGDDTHGIVDILDMVAQTENLLRSAELVELAYEDVVMNIEGAHLRGMTDKQRPAYRTGAEYVALGAIDDDSFEYGCEKAVLADRSRDLDDAYDMS